MTSDLPAAAAATPTMRLEVETIPSLAPSTAALSQPMRPMLCRSLCNLLIPASTAHGALVRVPASSAMLRIAPRQAASAFRGGAIRAKKSPGGGVASPSMAKPG